MSRLSRWYVRTSFTYLVAGLALGIAAGAGSVVRPPALLLALGPVWVHLLTVGWLTQLIFGVMHWMFPKHTPELPRGHEEVVLAAYLALNIGLLLRLFGEPLTALRGAVPWGWLLVLSALLQWLGGTLFIINIWPRVRGR